jgi:hypothetical protein
MSKGPPQLAGSINPIVDSIVGRFSTVLATKFYGHTENFHDKCLRSADITASELYDQMHNAPGPVGDRQRAREPRRTFAAEADYLSVFGADGTITPSRTPIACRSGRLR